MGKLSIPVPNQEGNRGTAFRNPKQTVEKCNPINNPSYITDTFNTLRKISSDRNARSANVSKVKTVIECTIPGTICNQTVDVLIDSGATHCMIGDKFFRLFPQLRKNLVKFDVPPKATAINGTTVLYKSFIDFVISFNNIDYDVCALYSPQIDYAVVLGLEFLKCHEITFDFKNNYIKSTRKSRVRAAEDIVLPANTESTLWGNIDKMEEGDAMVTNSDVMPQLNVFVAAAVVHVKNQQHQVPIRVMNPNSTDRIIRKNTKMADIRLLTDQEKVTACSATQQPQQKSKKIPAEFKNKFDLTKSTFNSEQQEKLFHLLWQYEDVFSRSNQILGKTDVLQFEIELKEDAVPFKARPYRSNPHVRQEIRRQVQEMIDKDIIEPSSSNFGSPVLLVSKPDGSYRFCIDYRKLNAMTKVDCHPIPRSDDCLESLGASGAKYFSSLDLESGYWQLPVHPKSRPYTAFVTHDGLYQCKRMSFGLVNAPSVFTRLMTRVLQGLNWEICLVYIDDVIIFSSTFEEHLSRLRKVFDRFRSAGLTVKPKKSFFGQERIKFLGHFVSERGIEPMDEKCEAVRNFPTPTKAKEVKSFLGLAGYYRRFIKDFSKISGPLIELTKQDVTFNWTEACEEAFSTLKSRLMSSPILAYPNYNEPYILQTDASGESIGMILAQNQNGKERVIAYAGKRLSPSEKNYSTTEKEALSVIEGLKHFDPYLRGNHVTIVTDHSALVWLLKQKQPKGRIARWIAYLQQFDYDIEHKAGKKHSNADALSRRDYDKESKPDELVQDDEILPPLQANAARRKKAAPPKTAKRTRKNKTKQRPVYKYPDIEWTPQRVAECQQKDLLIKGIVEYQAQSILPDDDKLLKEVIAESPNYVTEDGILFYVLDKKTEVSKTKKQIEEIHLCLVVPKELRHDVLTAAHGDLTGGHYGTQRTYTSMRLKYFWKGMYQDCKNWVLSCTSCNQRKNPVKPLKAELQPLPPVMTNERWAMDIVTLPRTERGNRYVLTFTEYNTRFVEAFPLKETSSKTIARVLVDEICFRYGAPQTLLSDLGANLVSEVMAETCSILKIERLFTAPYRPQTDGLLEKYHHTMCKNLSMYVNDRHDDWDLLLRGVCYSYNTTTCVDSTQFSPYYLMYGREPLHPIDTVLPPNKVFRNEVGETIAKVQFAREKARDNIAERQKLMKERYDKDSNQKSFSIGDLVWVHFPEVMVGGSRKFFLNWSGPYIVIEKVSNTNYRVAHAHNSEPLRNEIHLNRMKRFYHRSVLPPKPTDSQPTDTPNDITDLNPNDRQILVPPDIPSDVAAKRSTPHQELLTEQDKPPQLTLTTAPVPREHNEVHEEQAPLSQQFLDLLKQKKATTALPQSDEQNDTTEEKTVDQPTSVTRRESLEPPVSTATPTKEFEINKIIKGRYNKTGEIEYLIDWKNYPPSHRSFEPYNNLNESAKKFVDSHNIPITGKKK